jgi:diguanylate cyclase (GGDEF)-like protein
MVTANLATDIFSDEARRVAALHALALLNDEPKREFDSLVALAAEMLDCPTAMLMLIDSDRHWIKAASAGVSANLSTDLGLCDYTIRSGDPLVIEDLARDPRFASNPLATRPDGLRFYAGVPIHATEGSADTGRDGAPQDRAIGALCICDSAPRSLSPAGRRALIHLATVAETTIAARAAAHKAISIATTADRQAATLTRQDRIFRQAERMASFGSWRVALADDQLEWSDGVYRIHGLSIAERPSIERALEFYPPDARTQITNGLATTIETGVPFDIEVDFTKVDGTPRRVRVMGEREGGDESPVALVGVFQDVTERHALEVTLRRSADTDSLTGIANRAAFDRALDAAIVNAHARETPLLLVLIDLDGFKAINDTLGHIAGDDVLRSVGRALQAPWLKGSFVARLGGDEFAILVEDPVLAATPERISTRLDDALHFPIALRGLAMVNAGTVGIAALDPDCRTARDFVHHADTILYRAKRARVGERRRAAPVV